MKNHASFSFSAPLFYVFCSRLFLYTAVILFLLFFVFFCLFGVLRRTKGGARRRLSRRRGISRTRVRGGQRVHGRAQGCGRHEACLSRRRNALDKVRRNYDILYRSRYVSLGNLPINLFLEQNIRVFAKLVQTSFFFPFFFRICIRTSCYWVGVSSNEIGASERVRPKKNSSNLVNRSQSCEIGN